MAKARLLFNNFLTAASMITPSSTAVGQISKPQKEGSGSGTIQLGGEYSNSVDLDYLLQIDAAGDVGAATYKWSDDGGESFDATGVTITTVAAALNNGITVLGVVGSGTDFALNDIFRWKAFLPYGKAKLIDRDPDTEHRTANATAQLTHVFDLSEPKIPQALVIHYHNFTNKAVIRLQANSSDSWAAPAVNEVVTWRSATIVHYIAAERARYRYWRLFVDNIGNSDGYYRIANIYLGPFTELARSYALGDIRRRVRRGARTRMSQGRFSGGLLAEVSEFEIEWNVISDFDRAALVTAWNTTNDIANLQILPIFFDPDSALGEVVLCEWDEMAEISSSRDVVSRFNMPMRLIEIPRTILVV